MPTATGGEQTGAGEANRPSNEHAGFGKPGRIYHAITGELVAVVAVVPGLKTINPLNRREHHFARASRVRREKLATLAALRATGRPMALPVVVTLTRISARAMDSDGAVASLKAVRDTVAMYLGVDDRDSPRLVWRYAQERGPMGVRISIWRRESCQTSE